MLDAVSMTILRLAQSGAPIFEADERTGELANPELLNQVLAMAGLETDAPTIEGD